MGVGERRRESHCPKLGAWSPSAQGRERFYGWDRGVHGEKASVTHYSGNLYFLIFSFSHTFPLLPYILFLYIVEHVIVVPFGRLTSPHPKRTIEGLF